MFCSVATSRRNQQFSYKISAVLLTKAGLAKADLKDKENREVKEMILCGTNTCNMSSSTSVKGSFLFPSQLQWHCFEYFIACVEWILTLHRQNNTEWCRHLKEKRHRGDWQHAYTYCHKHLSNGAAEWHQHKGWHGWINLLFQWRIRKQQISEMGPWQQPTPSKTFDIYGKPSLLDLMFWSSSFTHTGLLFKTTHLYIRFRKWNITAPKLPLKTN